MVDVTAFKGNVPQNYDDGMGPVIFEAYGEEVARRVPRKPGQKVLEIAAGTGRLTSHLVRALPDADFTATDLNPDMLEIAKRRVSDDSITWQQADALELPFPDNSFDLVLAQFSVMFYPDKDQGQREAYRVLKPGGKYIFAVWGNFADNPWAGELHAFLGRMKPEDPPMFLTVPFGYSDEAEIRACLERAGFQKVMIEAIQRDLYSERGADFARGNVLGSPMASGLTDSGVTDLEPVIAKIAALYREKFGEPMRSTMNALIVSAEKR